MKITPIGQEWSPEQQKLLQLLPPFYDFGWSQVFRRLNRDRPQVVGLQFPEGLIGYGSIISRIIQKNAKYVEEVIVLADVAYGACCISDLLALQEGCQLLIHFGHSCLVSVEQTVIPCLYVLVSIRAQDMHEHGEIYSKLSAAIKSLTNTQDRVVLCSTIQYAHLLARLKKLVDKSNFFDHPVQVPRAAPLSPGELLGCTCFKLNPGPHVVFYIGEGRFHLESIMLSRPELKYFQWDPWKQAITRQELDIDVVNRQRAKNFICLTPQSRVYFILSVLGRQGNPRLLNRIKKVAAEFGISTRTAIIGELSPDRINSWVNSVDLVIPIGCPRLTLDWAHEYPLPMLTPQDAIHLFKRLALPQGDCLEKSLCYAGIALDCYRHDCDEWGNYGLNAWQKGLSVPRPPRTSLRALRIAFDVD